uniref:Reverse transcriptase Ty1/copia-type domain-containing protein n=1 Tax=Solanum lycopersicum TaxID=4081 RepID=A0A3Q7J622_SOLLC
MREINNLKKRLFAAFETNDLGPATQILGMNISRDRFSSTLNLSQELYIEKVLSRFRPDIAHAVGVVSRYMTNPGKEHWEIVKWLLRYLRGTSSTSLCLGKGNVTLQGFLVADLGEDVYSSKSTSGYIYTIGGTVVSWMSRLQKCVSLSSTEAEYVAIA